jgi:hypothetical protein
MKAATAQRTKKSGMRRLVPLFVLIFLGVILIPPCRRISRYAAKIRQAAAFFALSAALELFANERGGYPPSDANDPNGLPYCGAMKITEAMLGQDLLGFHPSARFRVDGLDPRTGQLLYVATADSLQVRTHQRHVPRDDAHRLADVYGRGNTGSLPAHVFVLCDVFERKRPSGRRTGMPILYYRANTARAAHDVNDPENADNIYDYRDNHAIVALGVPGDPNAVHPLAEPRRFYLNTRSDKIVSESRPHRPDKFILLSAGKDGLYGTADDVFNFAWKYRED